MYIKIVRSDDLAQTRADLTPAQLKTALAGRHPRRLSGVNRLADAWAVAAAPGVAGAVHWSIDDLVDAGFAVRTLSREVRRRRAAETGKRTQGRFRWVDEKTGALL